MEEWVTNRTDFAYFLCLDVSRRGRFQDIDLSAQFSAQCKTHRKQVIYTSIGKPREDDPLYPVYVQFERFRAAQYSRELSDKVWRGCVKIVGQGYWASSILRASRLSLTGVLPNSVGVPKVQGRLHLPWQHDTSESQIQFLQSYILSATTKRVIRFVFPICNERKVSSKGREAKDRN